MKLRRAFLVLLPAIFLGLVSVSSVQAQSTNATLNGLVLDTSGAVVPGVSVQAINDGTNIVYPAKTNNEGIYAIPDLPPGRYHLQVSKPGFKTLIKPDIILNVQDAHAVNFTLQVGAASETVTVQAGVSLLNTESATVSTVVDRQFAENLPLNGRSFQTLIDLTPGVVLTTSTQLDPGQFSVNGQRAIANYWMVDGVGANVGLGASSLGNAGQGLAGALAPLSVLGGTNSLVSVDAMQEFRIQTSTYAPEFGRTPGGQISIATRSGTNQFHGTLFNYFRNDILDANDWFADNKGLPKPRERQNDFGGTFGGPILRDKTFFFFSYEGLRLRLPQVGLTIVPNATARTMAIPAMQPFLNAYPQPNGPEVLDSSGNPTGAAQFNASYSNRATLDAYSIRVDHKLRDKLQGFGRYNYSPSEIDSRGGAGDNLSNTIPTRIRTQTATLGAIWTISPAMLNDLRFNYSRVNSSDRDQLDSFGGAAPLTSLPFPSPYTSQNGVFSFFIFSLPNLGNYNVGPSQDNIQRQINIVDSFSLQTGSHSLKFGLDYRRLSPVYNFATYQQGVFFFNVPSAETGQAPFGFVQSRRGATFLFRNLGAFAQDTWRISPRLTLTYGLRWDVDFAPTSLSGPSLSAATGFNLNNLSQLGLAPAGTPAFQTTYDNFAPRLGVAYQLSPHQDWGTVLRGGFGVFYDLATQEVGNGLITDYPFDKFGLFFGHNFPFDPAITAPPAILPPNATSGTLFVFDPHLKLPYTLEWNVAFEQALGGKQTISASYIGSRGRRLIQTGYVTTPNFFSAQLITNAATSDYNALQVQFRRRLSRGLQVIASYTWAHSIDDASTGSGGNNFESSLVLGNPARGPSDFDIRNGISAGVTYDVPAPRINAFSNAILRGWSLQSVVQVRSAPPVTVYDSNFLQVTQSSAFVRPDVVSGIPLYLYGSQYPGGKIFNNTPGAVAGGCPDGSQSVGPFCPPPVGATGIPLRQGNLGRNALLGFGAAQWDFGVHRDFPIRESLRLQFRAEMFNILNHPNFGPPVADITNTAQFGRSTQMLGQSLGGSNVGGGGLSPLYQIGGPRSIQLALKLIF